MTDILKNPDDILAAMIAEGGEDGITTFETGRMIATFREGAADEGVKALSGVRKSTLAHSSDFAAQDVSAEGVSKAAALVFDELGVAVLDEEAGAATMAATSDRGEDSAILSVEPEILMFPTKLDMYLRGFAAAAERIREDLAGVGDLDPDLPIDEDEDIGAEVLGATWGIRAVRATSSRWSGRGIRIAILDTGMDFGHPDFRGRPMAQSSFISGQSAQDIHSHGTHCTGTAAGPRAPAGAIPRYGCAHEAQIFVGKVLSNTGGGTSASVLAGMNWAIANRCQVISMSLGGSGGPYTYYTTAGARALAAGCLIIAASGNDSNRPGSIAQTGAPANSPTIMSVGSLDSALRPSRFSNGHKVEIAGPGSDVFSSHPRPRLHSTKSGTSMATPHVAGCAAMWAQSNPALRGVALWRHLQATARRLPHPARDVGAGLVQAPQ